MKRVLITVGITILSLFIILIILIFTTSYPLPDGSSEIIQNVFAKDIPSQIKGDTGRVQANGVRIWYESIQPVETPKGTILLIMGLGGNAIEWPLYFVDPLIEAGYHVIRFDNRGTGLSSWTDDSFTIEDMTQDALSVLDRLKVDKAHIIGMSLGGFIGQRIAIEHPERLVSLTSLMSSGYIDDPELPQVSKIAYISLITTGVRHGIPKTEKNIVESTVSVRSVMAPELSRERMLALAEQSLFNQRFRKGFNPRAFIQHTWVVRNSGSRYEGLKGLNVPVLVVHGKDDPLIPVAHGIKTAATIPGAKLLVLEGMGHDLSPEHSGGIHQEFFDLVEAN